MQRPVEPITCGAFCERIETWMDGDLSPAEKAVMEAHLEICENCRMERSLAGQVSTELRSLPEFDLPESVLSEVRSRTRGGVAVGPMGFLSGLIPRPVLAAAAVTAVVVAAIVIVEPWNESGASRYSEQEIERATLQTRLALAYVGSVARRAEIRVKHRVLDENAAVQTVSGIGRSIKKIGEASAASAVSSASPSPQEKGS
jgi:anti-sigma factor RsiW